MCALQTSNRLEQNQERKFTWFEDPTFSISPHDTTPLLSWFLRKHFVFVVRPVEKHALNTWYAKPFILESAFFDLQARYSERRGSMKRKEAMESFHLGFFAGGPWSSASASDWTAPRSTMSVDEVEGLNSTLCKSFHHQTDTHSTLNDNNHGSRCSRKVVPRLMLGTRWIIME